MAAEYGSKLLPNPPATPTQLTMLVEGMTGDSSQIRHDVDKPKLCTTVLAPNVVQQFESQIPPIAGFSLRLLSSQSHYAWLESYRPLLKKSLILSLLSLLSCFASYAFEPVVGFVLCYLVIGAALVVLMKSHLRWRIEMIQPPPPSVRLHHAALGLSFAFFLCIFVKYLVPISISDWDATAKNWRNFKSFVFVVFFAIPTDEIVWSAACVLPFLARVACAKISPDLDDYANSTVNRRFGYSVVIAFSFIYGIWLSLLLRVSLFAPNYGFFLLTLVGLGACILVIKTEKLVAGVVFKVFIWLVMLFWLE